MLAREACQAIVFGLALLDLDYSNTILANLPDNAVSKMQRVLKITSHIVLHDEHDPTTTKCLQKLHWLQMQWWIKFKILTLVYRCLNKQASNYLSNLLTINPISDWSMCANSKFKQLILPFHREEPVLIEALFLWVQNIGMNCQMKYGSNLMWKVFAELLNHTYSVKHTIKDILFFLSLF